jgi:hypothetical protein
LRRPSRRGAAPQRGTRAVPVGRGARQRIERLHEIVQPQADQPRAAAHLRLLEPAEVVEEVGIDDQRLPEDPEDQDAEQQGQ